MLSRDFHKWLRARLYFATGLCLWCGANTFANNSLPAPVPITAISGFSEARPEPNVIVVWNGKSKFGGLMVKRGAHWYASSGFVVSTVDFLVQEARIREGAIVFLHDGVDDFHNRKLVLDMARFFSIAGTFQFYSCEEVDCPKPAYRQYFDSTNRKIHYPDAPP